MDIFISWSGAASQNFAITLKEWLPSVIQSIEPFISSEDISKGSRWFTEIGNRLEKTNFGILCLTSENIAEPWILFEAGALSKSIGESRVAPILLDLNISDLKGPLAQFNSTLANKEEIKKLLISINSIISSNGEKPLDSIKLDKAFEAFWPDLEQKIDESIKLSGKIKNKTKEKKREVDDILEELLELSRNNTRLISELPNTIRTLSDLNISRKLNDSLNDARKKKFTDEMLISENERKMLISKLNCIEKEILKLNALKEMLLSERNSIDDEEHNKQLCNIQDKIRSLTEERILLMNIRI